jgi:hypothetical protein
MAIDLFGDSAIAFRQRLGFLGLIDEEKDGIAIRFGRGVLHGCPWDESMAQVKRVATGKTAEER